MCCDTARDTCLCSVLATVPSWTLCYVQVLAVHRLQITDDEYLTVWRLRATWTTLPISAHYNRLPLCDSCLCTSTTRLGTEVAVFHRRARLGTSGGGMMYWDSSVRLITRTTSQLGICRKSTLCRNHLRTPFVTTFYEIMTSSPLKLLKSCPFRSF